MVTLLILLNVNTYSASIAVITDKIRAHAANMPSCRKTLVPPEDISKSISHLNDASIMFCDNTELN